MVRNHRKRYSRKVTIPISIAPIMRFRVNPTARENLRAQMYGSLNMLRSLIMQYHDACCGGVFDAKGKPSVMSFLGILQIVSSSDAG